VAGERAARRGTSPALVAALHAGSWELWESAARALKDSTGEDMRGVHGKGKAAGGFTGRAWAVQLYARAIIR
jgi:hypothetical protein